ncbi:MAG TPA: family 1 glycosylhydrolase, partial [Anaerolineales bacterium]|nr:family 1 glycosylhydrolase [Anaerolineales bacterium]
MVDGADQIDIVNIPVGGQRNELPIIGGPFNPEVLDPVSGRKQLNISATYTWNGIYELRARNRCMSHHEYVSKQVSVQMQVPFDPSPGNFLWGVATAGRQFEGGLTADDWQIFTTSPEIISRLNYNKQIGNQWLGQNLKFDIKDAGDALRHWNLAIFREELDRARALGLNAYRISIEWSRVETSRFNFDEAALANYQAMINEIRKRVMEPIVVLNHMSLPAWVLTPPKQTTFLFPTILQTADANDPDFKKQPGWENEDTADMFIEYVQKVVSKLKDKVTYWITFNEPFGTIIPTGYLAGVFPPGFLAAGDRVKRVADTIINAHVRAYHAIKDIDPEAKVGITDQWLLCKPKTDNDRDVAATDQYIYFHQDYLLNAVVKGEYHPNFRQGDADTRRVLDIPTEKWQPAVDFIGLQYYKSVYVSFIVPSSMWWPYYYSGSGDSALFEPVPDMDISRANYPHNLLNDMGWEMYPEGLYKCLLKLRDNYKNKDGVSIPVLISENGTAEIVDRNRAAFITAHIDQMFRAINEGAHVIGYLHWSIADNWEWIDGYRPEVRFGLFSVDRNQNNLPHHITEGALALQYVVAENKAQQARDNFGYYTSQGDAVKPPKKTAGALWEGKLDDGTKFTLYVSRFTVRDSAEAIDPARSFLGMICYHNTHSWVRLETFYWDNEVGILHFCHSGVEEIGIPARVFEAQPDADNKLNGNASELEEDFPGKLRLCFKTLNWQAQRVIHYGIWNGDLVRRQSREQSMPFTLFFSQMEGDFSGWHGKILFHDDPLPEWEPLNNLHIHATVGMPFDCLVYRPQGSIFISGAIAGRDGMGCDMMIGEFIPLPGNFLSWQATKAPDDLPF